jgi:hypothetical protein
MYKISLVLFFVAVMQVAFGQGIPSPSIPKIMLDDGTIVGSSNPLPTSGVVTIGTATINVGAPPTENSMDVVSVTAAAQNVASLVNRRTVNVFNTSDTVTAWISLDSVAASATVDAGIPVFPRGFIGVELDSVKVLSIVASSAITCVVYQDGD